MLREAENAARTALKLDPDFSDSWRNLGIVLHTYGLIRLMEGSESAESIRRFKEAKTALEKATALYPKDTLALSFLGMVENELGERNEADATLKRLEQIDPDAAGYLRSALTKKQSR